jgi:hypothetical protein
VTDIEELSAMDLRSRAIIFAFQLAAAKHEPITRESLFEDAEAYIAFVKGDGR